MKKFVTLALAILCMFSMATAQKVAVVDVAFLLDNMDAYVQAQEELDKIADQWQQEIAIEHEKIKSMYNKYQAEQVLLSDEMKIQREEEIVQKEKEVRQMQKSKFGPDGALFQKRQALVSPIQERVYGAIEDFAAERGYDIIIDKGGSSGIIFSNEEFDKTQDIMRRLK